MRGYCGIGLHNSKDHLNIGSALRACMNYNASFLAVSGRRYHKSKTDTMKAFKTIPLFQVEDIKQVVPYGCVPVAVDLINDADSLPFYEHPERAFYIFGPEDGTLNTEIVSWCRDVIYIPTNRCMNLANTVSVVLYDRMAKQLLKENQKQGTKC